MFAGALVVLVLAATAYDAQADCVKSFKSADGAFEVTSNETTDWWGMSSKCSLAGSELIKGLDDIVASERKLCKGGIVPTGDLTYSSDTQKDTSSDDTYYEDFTSYVKALDLTSGLTKTMDMDATYTCALCKQSETTEIESIAYNYNDAYNWEYQLKKYYNVKLVSKNQQKVMPTLTEKRKTSLQSEIATKVAVNSRDVVYQSSKLNSNGNLEMDFHYQVDAYNESSLLVDELQNVSIQSTYLMSVEDITDCPAENVTNSNGGVTVWTSDVMNARQLKLDFTSWLVTLRKCEFNVAADRVLWSTPTVWQIVHEPCSDIEQYADQIKYKKYLDPSFEYNQKHQLQKFTKTPANVKDLGEVARLTSREIRAANELTSEMHDDLKQILVELQTKGKDARVQDSMVNFVVADLSHKGGDVNGFTLSFEETNLGVIKEPISLALNTISSPNVTDPRPTVSLTVSKGLIDNSNRVAFAAFWKPMYPWSFQNSDAERYLEVDVILVGPKVGLSTVGSFVDVAYDINSNTGATNVTCELVVKDDFLSMGYYSSMYDFFPKMCTHLETKPSTYIVCRCDTKYFVDVDGVLSGTFKFKETISYDFSSSSSSLSNQLNDIYKADKDGNYNGGYNDIFKSLNSGNNGDNYGDGDKTDNNNYNDYVSADDSK